MASDADKNYRDQGSSFKESFAPIVDALTNAYNAYMDADENYSDFVDAEFEDAALLIADAGFTAADFLGNQMETTIIGLFSFSEYGELEPSEQKVWDWMKETAAPVLSPLVDAAGSLTDYIKRNVPELNSNPLDSVLSYIKDLDIDRPLKKWVKGEIEELGNLFKKGSPKLDIGRAPGRVEHQKKLLETVLQYLPRNKKEARALRDEANAPRLGGDRLNWDQNRYIYPITDPGSSDAKNMVLDWVQSLDDDELEEFTSKETYDELEAWIDAAPGEGATINDQMVWISGLEFGVGESGSRKGGGTAQSLIRSLATDDAEVFDGPSSTHFEKVLAGDFLPTENSPENREARATGAADIEAGERDRFVAGVSDVSPTSPVPTETGTPPILGRGDESSPSGRWSPETGLAEAEAGIVPDGRPAWDQRQDFLAATAVAEDWTAPGREPPAEKDGDDNENTNPYDLTDEAYKYITENFGSVDFFLRQKDLMEIDTNGDGVKDTNIIDFIEDEQEENPDVIWGLFQKTEWFALNGPTARQFQVDWDKAQPGGADPNWSPQWNRTGEGGWTNMTPDMLEMLDDTYDSLVLEASRLLGASAVNTPAKKEAIMQMAYNARQLNMTDYELKNEFIENSRLAFDPIAIRSSGTFGAIRNKLKSNAGTYMITIGDDDLDRLSQQIYLNKATYEGLSSIWAQQAREDNPAVASLIDQGYTPSAYFSSYANVASNLLGRQIDFLGNDNKMYGALTDTMIGENGLERPMTRGEFKRYVRQTPEWDTTENARDEAYSTVGTLLDSFGINN
jgi:hypothetical protein